MDQVSVFRVLEAELAIRPRRAQSAGIRPPRRCRPEPTRRIGKSSSPGLRRARPRFANPSRSLIPAATMPGACAGPSFQPTGTLQERSRLPAEERLHEPVSRLVAGLLLEPQDAFSVESRRSVDRADRVVRDPAVGAAGAVPGVHLPDAGLAGRVHDAVRGVRRPLGQRRDRRPKAPLPHGHPTFEGAHLGEANRPKA
jgi:hypothetical protein